VDSALGTFHSDKQPEILCTTSYQWALSKKKGLHLACSTLPISALFKSVHTI